MASILGHYVGAFALITIITRLLQWLLKKKMTNPYYRAAAVFGLVAVFSLILLNFSQENAEKAILFFLITYLPCLVVWLLIDILLVKPQNH